MDEMVIGLDFGFAVRLAPKHVAKIEKAMKTNEAEKVIKDFFPDLPGRYIPKIIQRIKERI